MLPAYLNENQFLIYGDDIAQNAGWQGIIAPSGFAFGTVYKIWDNGDANHQVGDSVMVKDEPICRLAWDNGTWNLYTLDKIIITDNTGALP